MQSHTKILSRLLLVMPGATCETTIVGDVAKTDITYKDFKILIEQVCDDVYMYCKLSSETIELVIKARDADSCANELAKYVSRIIGRPYIKAD